MQVGIPNANSGGTCVPMPPKAAEEEYSRALTRLTGEQYELMPPIDPVHYTQPSPLYTIRHVLRKNPSGVKILGVYYVVEGVIYKSPSVRSLMKANVTRTVEGLAGACSALSVCARFQPSTGYTWNFDKAVDDYDDVDPVALMKLHKRTKRRKVLDNRKTGERNEAEEEGLRATSAIDQILVRLSKSSVLTTGLGTPGGIGGSTVADPSNNTLDGEVNGKDSTKIAVAEPTSTDSSPSSLPGKRARDEGIVTEAKQ